MRKIRFNCQKRASPAFTLIELLVYLGLYSILITVIMSLFTSILESRTETTQISQVEIEGGRLLSRLQYDIYRATSITTPATLGQTSSTLVLTTPESTTITYTVDAQGTMNLTRAGTTDAMTEDVLVEDFSIQRRGNASGTEVVEVTLDLASKLRLANQAEQKTFHVTLTNR